MFYHKKKIASDHQGQSMFCSSPLTSCTAPGLLLCAGDLNWGKVIVSDELKVSQPSSSVAASTDEKTMRNHPGFGVLSISPCVSRILLSVNRWDSLRSASIAGLSRYWKWMGIQTILTLLYHKPLRNRPTSNIRHAVWCRGFAKRPAISAPGPAPVEACSDSPGGKCAQTSLQIFEILSEVKVFSLPWSSRKWRITNWSKQCWLCIC